MAEPPNGVGIPLSFFVEEAARRLGDEEIYSWKLVDQIMMLSPKSLGDDMPVEILAEPAPSQNETRTAEGWLRGVADLFDPDQVQEIDGHLALLGLYRIDPTLAGHEHFAERVKSLEADPTTSIEKLLRAPPPEDYERPEELRQLTIGEMEIWRRAPNTVPEAALRVADMLANQASRESDSVLLLAGLLYQGSFDESPSAGRIWQHLMQTRYPDGMDLSGYRGPAVFDILNLGGSDYPISVSPNWKERDDYPAAAMYGAEWLRQRKLPEQVWPEDFEPPENFTSPRPPGPELERLLAGTRQLAANLSPDGPVRVRHLLGAMLSARLVDPLPAAQEHLESIGYDLDRVRQVLLDHIRGAPDGEPLDIWDRVLVTPDIPGIGYLTDMVDPNARDRLGITEEVENIAYVLSSRQVHPPLSLGLFGDWGSGKSFFMGKLRSAINTIAARSLAQERDTGKPAQWCSRVVQIDFNAWHYSDANLWASLVTHIYDELDRELTDRPSDRELREQIQQEMQLAEDVVKDAEARLEDAEARVEGAAEALQTARQSKEQAEEGVRALIDDVTELLKGDSATHDKLEEAADALGRPEAAQAYEALVELDADLKTFSGRLGMLSVSLLRTPWTLIVLALLVLGLPVAISLLLSAFAQQISVIWQRVAEASTFLIGLSAGLRVWIGRGTALIDAVETGLNEAQKVRSQRIDTDPEVEAKRKALAEAESAEQAARENLQDAQADLQRLETQLKELKPERRLLRLIEERASSAAYSQHLGIISLIRSDFERMSNILEDMSKEKRDLDKELPPIQRIILYIDDLDRCRPSRVVEVLEAVHLLLAFPLFVVVVGVDPRWLRHSLTRHYPATLAQTGKHRSGDGPAGPSLISTPQDYLEKIFQIPFALRPVEQSGYLGMLGDLLAPMREYVPTVPPRRAAAADEAETPARRRGDQADQREEGKAAAKEQQVEAQRSTLPPLALRELSPQQLTFNTWEEADIKRLWPLFRTPRTVKRFVNIYRLLRAGLADEAEIERFEGTEPEPGEYQVALLLLAVMTSFPNQSSRFLQRLDAWLEGDEVAAKPPEEASLHWAELLRALRETGGENGKPPGATGDAGTEAQPSQPPPSSDVNGGEEDQDPAWEGLIACLQQVTRNDFQRPFSRDSVERWARRVARYSFSIHPNQAL